MFSSLDSVVVILLFSTIVYFIITEIINYITREDQHERSVKEYNESKKNVSEKKNQHRLEDILNKHSELHNIAINLDKIKTDLSEVKKDIKSLKQDNNKDNLEESIENEPTPQLFQSS